MDAFREILTEEVEETVDDVRVRMGFSVDRLILLALIAGSTASVVGHQILRWRYGR